MLVNKIKDTAKKKQFELDSVAFSQEQIAQNLYNANVTLLGSQVGYTLPKVYEIC